MVVGRQTETSIAADFDACLLVDSNTEIGSPDAKAIGVILKRRTSISDEFRILMRNAGKWDYFVKIYVMKHLINLPSAQIVTEKI